MRASVRQAAVRDATVTSLRHGVQADAAHCAPEHFRQAHFPRQHSPEFPQTPAVVAELHGFLPDQKSRSASLHATGLSQDSQPVGALLLSAVPRDSLVVALAAHNSADVRSSALAVAEPRALAAARSAMVHSVFLVAIDRKGNAAVARYHAAATAACVSKIAAAASKNANRRTAATHTTVAARSRASDERSPATDFARNFAAADCAHPRFAGTHAGWEDSDYGVEQTTAKAASASMPPPSCAK
jgi:hypothetical protein